MSDEKNFNEENEETSVSSEETTEEVKETAEETTQTTDENNDAVEEAEKAVEEANTEAMEAQSAEAVIGNDIDNNVEGLNDEEAEITQAVDAAQAAFEEVVKESNKSSKNVALIVVVAIVAVLVVVLGVFAIVPKFVPSFPDPFGSLFNKYNRQGYVDVSGRTVAEVAEDMDMELDEFLEMYGLPADMPGNTTESAAYNNIPVSKMAETYGMDVAQLKEVLQMPETVTDETPWGEAIDQVTLGVYVTEEYLGEFKEYYGLDDSVTADTLWGEVRQTVEEKQREERIAAEKEAEEAENSATEETTDETAVESVTEAPAETAAATEAPAAE